VTRSNDCRRKRARTKTDVSILESILFRLTRVIVLCLALAAIVGIALCGMFLAGRFDKATAVSYAEVESKVSSGEKPGQASTTVQPPSGYMLTPVLERYMGGANRNILDRWLKDLDVDQQQDFISNLSQVVTQAESGGADAIKVINAYRELKLERVKQSTMDKYAATAAKGAAVAAILSFVFLILLASLVLVLLAIERHTRRATLPDAGQTQTT